MIKAKKQFGQNFLKDQSVLNKIIQAIPKSAENIVEIGSGLGDLTFWLLKGARKVVSYEIDDDLVPILKEKFKNEAKSGQFRLIHKDANLAWLEQGSLSDSEYILVANLPYYIATKMLLNALKDELCLGVIAMVQKEVALKFANFSEYNALGILANLNASSRVLFDVAPECFNPVPKVTSSVIEITKNAKLIGENAKFKSYDEYEKFQIFLKVCFRAPRKTLLKNLSVKFDKILITELFSKLNLNSNLRPHESNVALYLEIYKILKAENERK